MKRHLLLMLAGLSTVLGIGVAEGKECEGVSFPEQAQAAGTTLKLNGLGLRQATFMKVNVYVAALYVAQPSGDANAILESTAPKEIMLHFVRDVSRSDLNKGWDEGFEKNAKDELPALKERVEAFKGLMADMKTGQQLSFLHKPGEGVQVDVDGTVKGTIEGDDFARALFSVWLGSSPPNPELKAGLLGGECG
ncbi:MAG: chalcone isomerase family protein [Gammaproteobacteria bacterium]